MNGRILELARNPELFQIKDLELLNSEINRHPYIQSLRALHLLGTHRLKPENYANELSVTAAYTTDKKILYQLINSVEEVKPSIESVLEPFVDEEITAEEAANKFTKIESVVVETPKAVYVKGELNRILFEGEEDFLERETETIDLESTIESGTIVTQKSEPETIRTTEPEFFEAKDAENFSKENIIKEEIIAGEKPLIENKSEQSFHEIESFLPEVKIEPDVENTEASKDPDFTESTDAETFSKEAIVEEEVISEDKPVIQDSSKISFHATAEFLPEVKIVSNLRETEIKEIIKPVLNKHEEEMKRLIAEVEAKMKASKRQKTLEETPISADINFSETQTFEVKKTEDKEPEEINKEIIEEKEETVKKKLQIAEKPQVKATEISEEPTETKADSAQEKKPEWKPMSFSTNIPDALISTQKEETPGEKEKFTAEKIITEKQATTDALQEKTQPVEQPILNVSFFTENVSSLNTKQDKKPILEEKKATESPEDSNVSTFINTWQSWLKIDRTKVEAVEKIEISITEIKNKVIENFIEKEPRISKLKEESDFVIKERNDDISHLMTETLANLYTDQKLFAKAIKAFGLLSEKHPEKKAHFDDKIKEIKELRQNK